MPKNSNRFDRGILWGCVFSLVVGLGALFDVVGTGISFFVLAVACGWVTTSSLHDRWFNLGRNWQRYASQQPGLTGFAYGCAAMFWIEVVVTATFLP